MIPYVPKDGSLDDLFFLEFMNPYKNLYVSKDGSLDDLFPYVYGSLDYPFISKDGSIDDHCFPIFVDP